MRDLFEGRFGAAAPEAGKPIPACISAKSSRFNPACSAATAQASNDRVPRLVDAKPRRCRPRAALTEHRSVFILDPGAATASAAVNPEIQCACRHHVVPRGKLTFKVPSYASVQALLGNNPARLGFVRRRLTDVRLSRAANSWMTVMHSRLSSRPFTIAAPQSIRRHRPCEGRRWSGCGWPDRKCQPSETRRPEAPNFPPDAILAPGFIDIQVNGGGGVLLNDQPTEAGVRRIIETHRKAGTTGCLPTLSAIAAEVIERLAAVAQAC